MDPEDDETLDELRRRGAHVLTLDPTVIEGDPEADARREAVFARAAHPEAQASTPDEDSISALFARLPEIIRTSPILPVIERTALASFLESGEALPAHLASGFSGGWSDEAAGAASALPAVARSIVGGGSPESVREVQRTYEGTRDRERARLARTRRESPVTSLAGDVVGGLATAAIPGGLVVDAGLGALAGAGASDGGEDMLGDTVAGGALGAGGNVVGRSVGALAGGAGRAVRRFGNQAPDLRVESVIAGPGTPMGSTARRRIANLPGGMEGVAERIMEPRTDAAGTFRVGSGVGDLLTLGGTGDDALERLMRAHAHSGERAGAWNTAMDALLPEGVPTGRYTGAVGDMGDEWAGRAATRDVAPMARDVVATLGETATPSGTLPGGRQPNDNVREFINRLARDEGDMSAANRSAASEATGDIRRGIRKVYDDAAEEALGPGTRDAYRVDRHDYASMEGLRREAVDASRRRMAAAPSLGGRIAAAGERGGGRSFLGAEALAAARGAYAARLPAIRAIGAEATRGATRALEPIAAAAGARPGGGSALARLLGSATPAATEPAAPESMAAPPVSEPFDRLRRLRDASGAAPGAFDRLRRLRDASRGTTAPTEEIP